MYLSCGRRRKGCSVCVVLDPLQLDYRLITDTFGGPFAERHLIVTLDDQKEAMTLRDGGTLESRAGSEYRKNKGKRILPVAAAKRNVFK